MTTDHTREVDGTPDPADFGGVQMPSKNEAQRRVDDLWAAFGCAPNPDSFKASVQESMLQRMQEWARKAEAKAAHDAALVEGRDAENERQRARADENARIVMSISAQRDGARAALAVEREKIAVGVERLRLSNPMNGDGSNFMLDKVIDVLDQVAGDDTSSTAAAWERARRADEDDKRYCEMHGRPLPKVTHVEALAARIARSSTDGGGSNE